MPVLTVEALAALCGGKVEGDKQRLISGANTLEDAGADQLSFAEGTKAEESAVHSKAGCLLVASSFSHGGTQTLIRVAKSPRLEFIKALRALYEKPETAPTIHKTVIISESAVIGAGTSVGPYSRIGDQTQIGAGCRIGSGCSIGGDVTIGPGCILHDNVTLYDGVKLGERVTLHSGCVIGADGFGFALAGDHYEKFPQVGIVLIGNDVEIGANSCVDRAALGATRIGDGTKLDNLVHVAHNCTIGKHVVVAAQTGFSGSVTVGDYAVIGGQVGIADKAKIAAKSVIGAQAGIVTGQKIDAGEPVWGTPARPIRQHLKGLAHVGKLSETHENIKRLQGKLEALEAAFKSKGS
jgi:UDP-3-O-[3-hydroxymyristoyl] glucosamine N-acyltransferase